MKSILDPSFRYVSSLNTDLRKTFARIRRERQLEQQSNGRASRAKAASVIVRLRAGSTA